MHCYNCNSGRLKYDSDKDAYICLDCGYEFPKQYFFISHSHLDIEKVRIIRNIIEETFFYEPILFFLKCLSDVIEIHDLLKREIYERIWFVYCKSENAEKSEHVQMERNYIDYLMRNGSHKHLLTIELDDFEIWDEGCHEYIRKQIEYQIRKTKIFLSYSHRDMDTAIYLRNRFVDRGYSVWCDLELSIGDNWQASAAKKIREHSYKDGIFMPILTANALRSAAFIYEIRYALQNNAMVLPVVINDGEPINAIPPEISRILHYTLDMTDAQNSFEHLLELIAEI